MNKTLAPLTLVLGLSIAVPFALAAVPVCSGECEVGASSQGYLLPVTAVESGSNVTWSTLDSTPHVQRDTGLNEQCFQAGAGDATNRDPVLFTIEEDGLYATSAQGTVDEFTALCTNAVAAPTGDYVVNYHCILHPQMRGVLVVVPAA